MRLSAGAARACLAGRRRRRRPPRRAAERALDAGRLQKHTAPAEATTNASCKALSRAPERRAWSQAVADAAAARRSYHTRRWPERDERTREPQNNPAFPAQPLTRLSKNRKKRGSVSAGHGRIGKHRKHPGGRGNAGGQHHMRTLFDQFHPGYFGKVGMRQFHRTKARYHCPMINVEMLWSTLPEGTVAPAGQAPVVDVTQHGFFKVGGKGLVAKPMVVKAKLFTAVAEKKIKAAGGACILV